MSVANEAQLLASSSARARRRAGPHDALVSLALAIAQAEDYIYVEGPAFSAASFGNHGGLDLTPLIYQRLTDVPRLKVVICVPRLPDFTATKARARSVSDPLAHLRKGLLRTPSGSF